LALSSWPNQNQDIQNRISSHLEKGGFFYGIQHLAFSHQPLAKTSQITGRSAGAT
jgi:hypothetical protein